jgi:hypothetical protein
MIRVDEWFSNMRNIENDTTLVRRHETELSFLSCNLQGLMSVFPYYCMVLFIVFPHFRLTHLKSSTLLMISYPYQRHISPGLWFYFLWLFRYVSDNFHWAIACNWVCYTGAEFWNSLHATLRRRTGEVYSLNLPFPDISSHREDQCSNEILCIAFKIKMYNSRWFESKTVRT